ncbi:hypothetical protein N483_00045 [Pseudoalteromonas luteoviolacea NCIMB 1944]|uniref:Porin n=1 Tax=Pseudoalteromonas luteoviolacea (strain 2ta16) TaxID=1353533 RepID=V4JGQ8_PSEL2|nr:hypothetical protein PL2TA16_02397 [Pseudoalteromonas luteoviolacea 2ta16]KZN38792.1 hypothetical protein N483_00045 [Pseudoalteromonas luteoviolacea NCIMB 1944]
MVNSLKLLTIIFLSIVTSYSYAQPEKTWFNQATYTKLEDADTHTLQVSTHYYFAPQAYFWVWDDFGYLDTDSNIRLTYNNDERNVFSGVEGELFIANWFATASIEDLGDTSDNNTLGLGYLFYDSLKLSVRHQRQASGDDITWLQSQLNIDIDTNSYVGTTLVSDDEFENWQVEVRYFRHLGDQKYFTLDLTHENSNSKNHNNFIANYYFNQHFALGLGSNESHLLVEGKYFVNHSFFVKARYQEQSDDEQSLEMSMQAQF